MFFLSGITGQVGSAAQGRDFSGPTIRPRRCTQCGAAAVCQWCQPSCQPWCQPPPQP